jgi:hypothetical protein
MLRCTAVLTSPAVLAGALLAGQGVQEGPEVLLLLSGRGAGRALGLTILVN